MNKLLKAIIFIYSVFGYTVAYAQLCGQGVFELEVYTLNGTDQLIIDYEIFPINRIELDTVFPVALGFELRRAANSHNKKLSKNYSDRHKSRLDYNPYHGYILTPKNALRIIDTTEIARKEFTKLFKQRIPLQGKLKNGRIAFKTLETKMHHYVLKLSASGQDLYLIANFFGGCNRTSAILWKDNPEVMEGTNSEHGIKGTQ